MTINKMAGKADESSLGTMEQEAFKRKERLKALKRKAESSEEAKKPIFRSYQPQDEQIKENAIISEAVAGDIESEVQTQLDLLKTPIVIDEIDIANLAPRKPDWDLKRDVSKKLDKLEKRTQRAIAELIRDRLKNNQDSSTNLMLHAAVNVAATTEARPDEED